MDLTEDEVVDYLADLAVDLLEDQGHQVALEDLVHLVGVVEPLGVAELEAVGEPVAVEDHWGYHLS